VFDLKLKQGIRSTIARVTRIKTEKYAEQIKTIQNSLKTNETPLHPDFSSAMF